ncbi:MAG: beta-aspartyl-peptidase [Tindallia sp. MSAO_Bac2]|nr:MAG: beta-aspartyl-peptidase [Tindallia sp. MSAO_Bac2]
MNLEIREFAVKNIAFGDETRYIDHELTLNREEITRVIKKDMRVSKVEIDLARPGESVRILPVKDVIEPRTKNEQAAFPGILGEFEGIGEGITYALKNCAVVTTGPIVGFQEGIIDMSGPLTDYTPFAHLNNIVIQIEKQAGIEPHEHEEVVRLAGVTAAEFIARCVRETEGYTKKIISWKSAYELASEYPELPKVVYVYNCMSQGLLHDTYYFGKDSKKMLPTLVSPLAVYDGAIVSGNCVSPGSKTTTYHHQNNAIIEECFKRHGEEICFIGIVLTPLMITLEEKIRNKEITAGLVELIGADGVVQSQEGFGNPTTDLMMICEALEKKGIKTVIITNEDAGVDGKSESLPDGTLLADAVVTTGNSNAMIQLPPMKKVIGDLKSIERTTGGFVGSVQSDGSLLIEVHGIMGSHNLQGYSKLSAVTV